tara:strand:- start:1041 stop:1406 length:366 start_codon:yes stop_codon:yes gene_type:complete
MKIYFIERDAIAIAETSDRVTFTSVTEAKEVTLFCVKEDEEFVSDNTSASGIGMNEEPNIADEFHEALAYRVIQQGYERKPEEIQLAAYFKQQFNETVREAKKSANKNYDGSGYAIRGYDY